MARNSLRRTSIPLQRCRKAKGRKESWSTLRRNFTRMLDLLGPSAGLRRLRSSRNRHRRLRMEQWVHRRLYRYLESLSRQGHLRLRQTYKSSLLRLRRLLLHRLHRRSRSSAPSSSRADRVSCRKASAQAWHLPELVIELLLAFRDSLSILTATTRIRPSTTVPMRKRRRAVRTSSRPLLRKVEMFQSRHLTATTDALCKNPRGTHQQRRLVTSAS